MANIKLNDFLNGTTMESKHIVLHHFDADGFASASILLKELYERGWEAENMITITCNHNKPIDISSININAGLDRVYILDYSFSRNDDQDLIESLISKGVKIAWIDHHVTSFDILEKNPIFNSIVATINDKNGGACNLTWLWVQEPKIEKDDKPLFLIYVSSSDTNAPKNKIKNSGEFCLACSDISLKNAFFGEHSDDIYNPNLYDYEWVTSMVERGKMITEIRANINKSLVRSLSFEVDLDLPIGSYHCLALNGTGNSSVFGDHFEDYDAVILFTYNGTSWTYSMFSDSNKPEVAPVATYFYEKYGISGGGHPHACGWVAPENIFETLGFNKAKPVFDIK